MRESEVFEKMKSVNMIIEEYDKVKFDSGYLVTLEQFKFKKEAGRTILEPAYTDLEYFHFEDEKEAYKFAKKEGVIVTERGCAITQKIPYQTAIYNIKEELKTKGDDFSKWEAERHFRQDEEPVYEEEEEEEYDF